MNAEQMLIKFIRIICLISLVSVFLSACNGKFPGADARKVSADPKERVKKNLEEGRGFTLNKTFGNMNKSGTFDFASSNELWRASLDIIDFMPLTSVNYSGGIIVTDWYSDGSSNESIKISIRFLTNEIRSDSLKVKVYTKTCENLNNCRINENNPEVANKLITTILKKASIYKQDKINKKKKIRNSGTSWKKR